MDYSTSWQSWYSWCSHGITLLSFNICKIYHTYIWKWNYPEIILTINITLIENMYRNSEQFNLNLMSERDETGERKLREPPTMKSESDHKQISLIIRI